LPQSAAPQGVYSALREHGMSRRTFLKFCGGIAGVLALPMAYGPRIARALESAAPLRVVWLHGQACGGDSAAFLRSSSPTASELLLSILSVEYDEMLMAGTGSTADGSLAAAVGSEGSPYLAVIEGSIPRGADGMYCSTGGRPFIDVVREVTRGARATIAVGSCAVDGGAPAAPRGSTDAIGVGDLKPGSPLVNLPGCPVNVENLTATVVHYLTFSELPPMGSGQRPLFAYGGLIHNQCERRAHYEFGEYATEWGDAGAQQGWCLYKLGCKGPETFANCPTKRYAEGTSWAVESGHGCIGCTMPAFWETMLPAYRRLPSPLPFAPTASADLVGGALVGGVAALAGVHAAGSYVRAGLQRRRAAGETAEAEPPGEEAVPKPAVPASEGKPPAGGPDAAEQAEAAEAEAAEALPPEGVQEPVQATVAEASAADELETADAGAVPPEPNERDVTIEAPETPRADADEVEPVETEAAVQDVADDERAES